MVAVGIVRDRRFGRHLTAPGHPESPARLAAVEAGLAAAGLLERCVPIEARPVDRALLERVHTRAYLRRLEEACRRGAAFCDVPDSAICPESYEVALLAAGGVVEAARRVAGGELRRAFCAVRPPGHHAEADRSLGFCLLNNVALAARALREQAGLERVLILDWDVHHGNGTQHAFERDPSVFYVSLHGHPRTLYPGTGYETETGSGPGAGATLNVPLAPDVGDEGYLAAFRGQVLGALERFGPQMILVSAGFDAHRDDPLGTLGLSDEAFARLGQAVVELSWRHSEGRIVSVLEGGYNLEVLRRCVAGHVSLLAELG